MNMMSFESDEIRYRWEHSEPVKGVAFLPNDHAIITAGSHRGRLARVLALPRVHPQPEFDAELVGAGERLVLAQSALTSPVPEGIAECIGWVQKWYAAQCDGDWEHQNGVSIGTLDNPGWSVAIDLRGTDLEATAFAEVARLEPKRAWIACKVEGNQWKGAGGPHMLAEILATFVRWVQGITPANIPPTPTGGEDEQS